MEGEILLLHWTGNVECRLSVSDSKAQLIFCIFIMIDDAIVCL